MFRSTPGSPTSWNLCVPLLCVVWVISNLTNTMARYHNISQWKPVCVAVVARCPPGCSRCRARCRRSTPSWRGWSGEARGGDPTTDSCSGGRPTLIPFAWLSCLHDGVLASSTFWSVGVEAHNTWTTAAMEEIRKNVGEEKRSYVMLSVYHMFENVKKGHISQLGIDTSCTNRGNLR